MALTLEFEQRLGDAGLIEFFDVHRDAWKALAKKAHDFLKGNFPDGSAIRHDDVAKALQPLIEVNEELRDELHRGRLTQKYWIARFTDLIIDRTWNEITKGEGQ
jgi:hypothetical protein